MHRKETVRSKYLVPSPSLLLKWLSVPPKPQILTTLLSQEFLTNVLKVLGSSNFEILEIFITGVSNPMSDVKILILVRIARRTKFLNRRVLNASKLKSRRTSIDELLEIPTQNFFNWKSKLRREFKRQTIIEALEDYSLRTEKNLLKKMCKFSGCLIS